MSILGSLKQILQPSSKSKGWASKEAIAQRGLESENLNKSGIVLGENPYTKHLMVDDSDRHVLLVGPSRSGKSASTVIPTAFLWKGSLFTFDYKGELFDSTSGWREGKLQQEVLKFQPLCMDDTSAKWNPLAEIRFRTKEEWPDAVRIAELLVVDRMGGGDKFWENISAQLMAAVMVHLLYKHELEGKRTPNLHDVYAFFKAEDFDKRMEQMTTFPHITEDEFFGEEEAAADNGIQQRLVNPLRIAYGEYIRDFEPFQQADKDFGEGVRSIEDIRQALAQKRMLVSFQDKPWNMLLTHPKVRETCSSVYLAGAEQTRASILSLAKLALKPFSNPNLWRNMETSDFAIRDFLDANQKLSLYFVYGAEDMSLQIPISRLFTSMLLDAASTAQKPDTHAKTSNLLVLLDDVTMIGYLDNIQPALVVCGERGTRICIVAHNLDEIKKMYGNYVNISSNCGIQVYFVPASTGNTTSDAMASKLKGHITLHGQPLTGEELKRMSPKKELVLVNGEKPILGNIFYYFRRDDFNKMAKLPAARGTAAIA